MAKTTTKLNKKDFDTNLLELLKLDEESKKISKRMRELKGLLESQYELDPQTKEIIKGIETEMEKVPVNSGAHNYNVDKLEPYLQAIDREDLITVRTIKEVNDIKALEKLEKDGTLPPEVLDNCRNNNFTFKSQFRRIEAVAQKPAKVEKVATTEKKPRKKVEKVS